MLLLQKRVATSYVNAKRVAIFLYKICCTLFIFLRRFLMPQTKFQGVIFGLIMSFSMAYGMEVYNQCILHQYQSMPGGFSNMTNIVFLDALKETCFIAIFVFFFSNLYGNRLGQKLAHRFVKPKEDNSMALIFNLFGAGPFTRFVFRKIFLH